MYRTMGRVFDHILVIMFENQYRSYMMQNSYLQGLAGQGIDMANYFGVMHPSQTNYIASIAGELCNVTDDNQPTPLLFQNTIVDLIESSPYNLSWKAYMESYIKQNTPWTPNLVPKDEYPYVIKHNPFSSFANIIRNQERWNRITDENEFWKDLLNGTFPNYAWFTPNMWNDGHYLDGTTPSQQQPVERAPILVDQLAKWLESFFAALRFPGPHSHLPPRTLVVLTTDEADFEAKYDQGKKYTYDGPNQIYTVLLGDMIQPAVIEEGYNHYSLLKTIEKNFGLGSLQKNDADSNYFQFLWGKHFQWGNPSATTIRTKGSIALAAYKNTLYAVYEDEHKKLVYQTFYNDNWSGEQDINQTSHGQIALAACADNLILVYQTANKSLSALTYNLQNGWSKEPQQIVTDSISNISLTSYKYQNNLMLAYQDTCNELYSLRFIGGAWETVPTKVGHQTDGKLVLAVLGNSLYLIHKVIGNNYMNVISYNTADFNALTVPDGEWSGPYDNTTKDKWSPSVFPVAYFSNSESKITPGEPEPVIEAYKAGYPLVAATLEGVIHLCHPGIANSLVLTETFSIGGILTPEKRISYNESDETTTSNGYGTLAEAGWSKQTAINGVYNHKNTAMAMTQVAEKIILAFHPDNSGEVQICIGKYIAD